MFVPYLLLVISTTYKNYISTLPLYKLIQLHICQPYLPKIGDAHDAHNEPNYDMYIEVIRLIKKYPIIEYLKIEYYKDKASQITLLEINKNLANTLKLKFDGDKKIIVLNTDIHSQEKKFDTILYMDVLEHIENDEKEINKALKQLNSGGYLIFFVPAYQFLYSDFDKAIGHIKRYNKKF